MRTAACSEFRYRPDLLNNASTCVPALQLSRRDVCFFSSSSSCPGSLQFSRERRGVEVGLCLVNSVVALLFYMVECTCIGNKFLERS